MLSNRINTDFIRLETTTLTLEDYDRLESIKNSDLQENYWQLKEQIIGERCEWAEDVKKCFDDITDIIIGVKL